MSAISYAVYCPFVWRRGCTQTTEGPVNDQGRVDKGERVAASKRETKTRPDISDFEGTRRTMTNPKALGVVDLPHGTGSEPFV